MVKAASRLLQAGLVAAYPIGVFYGLQLQDTRLVALVALAAIVTGALLAVQQGRREHFWAILRVPLAVTATVIVAFALDDSRFILAVPVVISAALFLGFAASLRKGVSIVERIARAVDPELSQAKASYCRQVTAVWCVFFAANGAVAGALALFAPLEYWTVYTGLIAYVLIGALFGAEYAYRTLRFGGHGDDREAR